jgi:hypothetical protein
MLIFDSAVILLSFAITPPWLLSLTPLMIAAVYFDASAWLPMLNMPFSAPADSFHAADFRRAPPMAVYAIRFSGRRPSFHIRYEITLSLTMPPLSRMSAIIFAADLLRRRR